MSYRRMPGSRAGVVATRVRHTRPCDRCGRERQLRSADNVTGLCRDCLDVDPFVWARSA